MPVIYVIDTDNVPTANESESPFEIRIDHFYFPRHASRRFIAQQGLFLVQHDPEQAFTGSIAQRWILKSDLLKDLARNLRTYGITVSTLFPDLVGLCAELTGDLHSGRGGIWCAWP